MVLHVIAVLSLLIIALVTVLIGRVATLALTATGMPLEAARFQARSALTGVGFTSHESELCLGHPVRRRIIMQLMFVGPIGIIASSGTLIAALTTATGSAQRTSRLAALAAGLVALVLASRSRWVNRHLTSLLAAAVRRTTQLDVRDYAGMLRLAGDYEVAELLVEAGDWLAGQTLAKADLPHEGILVLGIVRATGEYVGAPTGSTELRAGDTLLLYGRDAVVRGLDERHAGGEGDRAHLDAIADHRRVIEDEQRRDAGV